MGRLENPVQKRMHFFERFAFRSLLGGVVRESKGATHMYWGHLIPHMYIVTMTAA